MSLVFLLTLELALLVSQSFQEFVILRIYVKYYRQERSTALSLADKACEWLGHVSLNIVLFLSLPW